MNISAALVKELRERTGSGMMECKKALVEANGDIELAVENMRKSGLAKADKKAGRTAAEGAIVIKTSSNGKRAVMVEVNSETDFVAKNEDFISFSNTVAEMALNEKISDVEALAGMKMPSGATVNEARTALVAKIGENINLRRIVSASAENGVVGSYLHGGRIGVLVELEGGDINLARDIAMHVAANKPVCVSEEQVPAELIEKEKEIFTAQAAESGKPMEIVQKMVVGRVNKFLKEVTLLGQPFVKNPDQTVAQLLNEKGATVLGFVRIEVGEGIEKQTGNFAEEVMAQVRGG
ncbi:MAG: translation elongation factor Ts [Pseudomonadota bacterium]